MPLKPGVLIRGQNRIFWQCFVYENLPVVCFRCGRIGHSDDCCGEPVECHAAEGEHPLCPENLMETHPFPMEVGVERETELGGVEARVPVVRPRLSPWMVTSKVWPPNPSPAPVKGKRATMVQVASTVPDSKCHHSPAKLASPPSSPPDCGGGKSWLRWLAGGHRIRPGSAGNRPTRWWRRRLEVSLPSLC